ncbi:hypothetical protein RA086_12700 [Lactiplantibacillus sp. WILCCON 0030]|uniref:Lipoprotein n=1 Tax=Lactiplantibacillus brownii TaxID=3069269 RepID=A0ABU1ABY6_9LACO|nr:hypothetical protein [Lactiplantibacillus brownii]MDQ7938469.1 hypothetical protein [Lactiplantibacillus brownii]
MLRKIKWLGVLLSLALLLGSLTACDERNPEVLKSEKWRLVVVTPEARTLGRASFTPTQIKVSPPSGSPVCWSYYFNSDDDLVIQAGRYAGTYVLNNQAKDFQLIPIKDATQTLEIQRLKK